MECDLLIRSIIGRLGSRLSSSKGKRIDTIESDPLVQQSVMSLEKLSVYTINTTCSALFKLLQDTVKLSPREDLSFANILYAQLFVSKIIVKCLTKNWRNIQDKEGSLKDPEKLDLELANNMISVLFNMLVSINSELENNDKFNLTLEENKAMLNLNININYSNKIKIISKAEFFLLENIQICVGQCLFYLSASNWEDLFDKIKEKYNHLTSSGSDESTSIGELSYLYWFNLNRDRLKETLNYSETNFNKLKKVALLSYSVVLKRIVWNYIEIYSKDFIELYNDNKNLHDLDNFFDTCYGLADNIKKKTIIYPLISVFLIISPLTLGSLKDKKAQFMENIKKNVKSAKMIDVHIICLVDMFKASSYLIKSSNNVLKNLLSDIEEPLKSKLFSNTFVYDNYHDLNVVADFITSLFRIKFDSTISEVVPMCIDEEAQSILPAALIKSIYNIFIEKYNTNNPELSTFSPKISQTLRTLFKTKLKSYHELMEQGDNIASMDKKAKKQFLLQKELKEEKLQIIIDILKIYQIDPSLIMMSIDKKSQSDELIDMMNSVTSLLKQSDVNLRTCAADLLVELHSIEIINKWHSNEEEVIPIFWKASSIILIEISKQAIESNTRNEEIKYLVDLTLEILLKRYDFMKSIDSLDKLNNGFDIKERVTSNVALETSLLTLLCSTESDICSLASQCFGLLCDEIEYLKPIDTEENLELTVHLNMEHYRALSEAGILVTGKVAQQKSIRKVLRFIQEQSPGNLIAWESIYKSWRKLKSQATRPPDEDVTDKSKKSQGELQNDSDLLIWQNYTGFLSSLGGCCIKIENPDKNEKDEVDPRELVDISFLQKKGTKAKKLSDPGNQVNRFIMELVELLICDNPLARETVRELLGTELTPTLYSNLFVHLESIIGRFFSEEGEIMCNDSYTLFVEQSISVLKLILERISENAESLFTSSLDMGNLLLSFARYLVKLGNGATSLRVKMKMCQLTEILMIKRNLISLKKEFSVRNKLLVIIVEWVSDFAKSSGIETTSFAQKEENTDKLWVDLDLACMKSVALLLDGLPLQPQEDTKNEAERKEANSKLFYKLFGHFTRLLDRARVLDNLEVASTTSAHEGADIQKMLNKGKSTMKDLGPLKDFTILALSNLLNANIESGLKYSLSMGYHADSKTRTSFMKVLTNILKQGVEFTTLLETTDKIRFENIMSILTDPKMTIIVSFCDVCPVQDIDDCATVILSLFDSRYRLIDLLKALIEREINKTDFSPELFRRNSMATRLLASFAKLYGFEFLKECLMPTLQEMIDNPISCEVDPSKVDKKDKVEENLKNLNKLTKSFLDDILKNNNKIPCSLREITSYLSSVVIKKFPEAEFTSVGGLIYLRFFCPAIVAPDVFGLVPTITNKEVRRGLLLITKVIQNLANNVFFGAKEAFMIPLNDLLDTYIPLVGNYLKEISRPLNKNQKIEDNFVKQLDDAELNKLHYYLVDSIERIGRDIVIRKVHIAYPLTKPLKDKEELEKTKRECKAEYQKLSILLAQLGQPVDPKKFQSAAKTTVKSGDAAFKEFMNNNANKNINALKEKRIFYEGALSKEKRPVYYLLLSKIVLDVVDFDTVLFYIFKTIGDNIEKPFELFVDVTGFQRNNEITAHNLKQFINMIPETLKNNLESLYFYNVNSQFLRFVTYLDIKFPPNFIKKVHFPCNLTEIYEFIYPNNLKLPQSTIQLETDNGMTFSPVTCIRLSPNNRKLQSPSIVKIFPEILQITMLKKQEILGSQCYFNEVHHIKEFTQISLNSAKDDKSLLLQVDDKQITLLSPKIELICKAMKNVKNKNSTNINKLSTEKLESREITSSKVPGTLLNMALLNSGSEDSNLRLASYNMLYALSVTFKFDVDNQILMAKDLCIPPNNTTFITNISEKLANTIPEMTFEFLTECFIGFKSSSTTIKHLCLEYMAPWLRNLIYLTRSNVQKDVDSNKTKEILRLMFDLSCKENDMGPSIQSKIWKNLAQVDEIIDYLLDCIVDYCIEFGSNSDECDSLADIVVTLSSTNVRAGKLVSRLRKIINKTSINPSKNIADHISFTEVSILVRFNLMISFNNRLISQHYLPEILHIVCMLLNTGSQIFKASIHGLLINVVQSLTSCINLNNPNHQLISNLLSDFSDMKYKYLFGINKATSGVFSKMVNTNIINENPNEISILKNVEKLAYNLLNIINFGALSQDQANIWRTRWMSLITSTAFQFNPAIQPRAFIVLGCLSKNEIDDDLITQILVALRGSLELMDNNEVNLIVSIILCLSNLVKNYTLNQSKYSLNLLWLGNIFLMMNNETLFSSGVQLLYNVLFKLDKENYFTKESLKELLLKSRNVYKDIFDELELLYGISFTNNFEFCLPILIFKQMKNNKQCIKLLYLLIDIQLKHVSINENKIPDTLLPFVMVLLPYVSRNKEMRELFISIGIENDIDNEKLIISYQPLLKYFELKDPVTSKLFISFLSNLVKDAEFETEYITLYGLLSELANTRIDLFKLVYLDLQNKMNLIINTNQTSAVIDSVQSILYFSLSIPEYSTLSMKPLTDFIDETGFHALLNNDDEKIHEIIKLTGYYLESII